MFATFGRYSVECLPLLVESSVWRIGCMSLGNYHSHTSLAQFHLKIVRFSCLFNLQIVYSSIVCLFSGFFTISSRFYIPLLTIHSSVTHPGLKLQSVNTRTHAHASPLLRLTNVFKLFTSYSTYTPHHKKHLFDHALVSPVR